MADRIAYPRGAKALAVMARAGVVRRRRAADQAEREWWTGGLGASDEPVLPAGSWRGIVFHGGLVAPGQGDPFYRVSYVLSDASAHGGRYVGEVHEFHVSLAAGYFCRARRVLGKLGITRPEQLRGSIPRVLDAVIHLRKPNDLCFHPHQRVVGFDVLGEGDEDRVRELVVWWP